MVKLVAVQRLVLAVSALSMAGRRSNEACRQENCDGALNAFLVWDINPIRPGGGSKCPDPFLFAIAIFFLVGNIPLNFLTFL